MNFLQILSVFTLAVMSPGPDFMVVLRASLSGGTRKGLGVAAGIGVGTSCWAVGTLLGIVTALRAVPSLASVLSVVGAVFLVLYGLRVLWGGIESRGRRSSSSAPVASRSWWGQFRLGLATTTVGNPKALIFYSVIFVAMVPASIVWWQLVVLVAAMVAISFSWFSLVSAVASHKVLVAGYERFGWLVDIALGALFVVLGVALLV